MEKFIIDGGKKLEGSITNQGAKNSTLGILVAAMLSSDTVELHNVPDIYDVKVMLKLIKSLGVDVKFESNCAFITSNIDSSPIIDADLAQQVRYSLLFLSLLLGKFGEAIIPLPGGCSIGDRKYDMHLNALRSMGAEVNEIDGHIEAKGKLRGTKIKFYHPTDTGTMNLVIAASLASGRTVIENVSLAPEIVDFMRFMQCLGVEIQGIGTPIVEISGKDSISGGTYTIMPDRIEALTYAIASAITNGNIEIANSRFDDMPSEIKALRAVGVNIRPTGTGMIVVGNSRIRPVNIITEIFPGFHTDVQALIAPLLCLGKGTSTIKETIFDSRFSYTKELNKLGANIEVKDGDFFCPNTKRGQIAFITGVKSLYGASITATDLRGGTGMLLAGLVAKGQTIVNNSISVNRGYENIVEKLTSIGASIRKVNL